MFIYLKEQKYYEDRYDNSTVDTCRSGERTVNKTFTEMEKKLPSKELKERKPGWYLQYSIFYFSMVEALAAKRYAQRDAAIAKWMKEDEDKDKRIADAHISSVVYCKSCGEDVHVISKDYMHREGHKDDDILIMLECNACNKRVAHWQDGTEWEGARIECEKCGGKVKSSHKTKDKVITTTYKCSKCDHSYKETLDLSKTETATEKTADPYLELDRKRFIFNSDMASKYNQKVKHLERLYNLHASASDRVEHADVYGAIKDIKKLKIAQLSDVVSSAIKKKDYSELKLGEPNIGREVSIDFNCLDSDADREDYQSKKQLQKFIDKALLETNWRLMSGGISHRLGYLSGRLRAYESEEDLKKLVEQRIKKGNLKPKMIVENEDKGKKPEIDIRESVLVYMDKLTLNSMPAEITLKSGKKKRTGIPYLRSELNPLLRVIIPMRDGDKSVPKFIRTFDFKMGDKTKSTPKITKDSMGREIRRL